MKVDVNVTFLVDKAIFPSGWTMRNGCLQASWLRQVEAYLKSTDMAGLASAWAMARRRPMEYRRKVDAATRCSAVFHHT